MTPGPFPEFRPRRLRRRPAIRKAVQDVHLQPQNLIYPLFVTSQDTARPVSSMPGIAQLPVSEALKTVERLAARGISQFILFGVTANSQKDAHGSFAQDPQAPVNQLVAQIRAASLDVVLYTDLCFCEYTDHGHCGIVNPHDPAVVDNDATLKILAATAVAQARAGSDIVAPSGMIDGQVAAIRHALDDAGFNHVAILSYSIKYASNFYGPFREAGEGAMKFGDRQGYQMDYRRQREWRLELQADLDQGADMVMVKPAGAYLDIIHQARQSCDVPLVAYQVSGEYAMLHDAAAAGHVDLRLAALESLYAIKRAGADLIITYFAPQLLDWL